MVLLQLAEWSTTRGMPKQRAYYGSTNLACVALCKRAYQAIAKHVSITVHVIGISAQWSATDSKVVANLVPKI
jgi:hypothetical protein